MTEEQQALFAEELDLLYDGSRPVAGLRLSSDSHKKFDHLANKTCSACISELNDMVERRFRPTYKPEGQQPRYRDEYRPVCRHCGEYLYQNSGKLRCRTCRAGKTGQRMEAA